MPKGAQSVLAVALGKKKYTHVYLFNADRIGITTFLALSCCIVLYYYKAHASASSVAGCFMRILMTGVTGFVGQNLAAALSGKHVLAALLRPDAKHHLLPQLQPPIAQLVWDEQVDTLPALIASFAPDVIIHLAGYFVGVHTTKDIDALVDSNVRFPTVLFESAVAAGCKQVIHVGSYWQHYGNAAYAPVNLYAAMKQSVANILSYYVQVGGLSRALTLELTDSYGSNDPRAKLIPMLQKAAENGAEMGMSPGDQYIDLVHIKDVVEGFVQALDQLQTIPAGQEQTYALKSINPIKLKEFVALFNEVSPKPIKFKFGERNYRPREMMTPWTSTPTLPNWKPVIDLRDGLAELLKGSQ